MGKSDERDLYIDRLKPAYFTSYLAMFSLCVQQRLQVSAEAEKIYLEHQYEAQERGYTFFYCVFEQAHQLLIGALEIRHPLQFPGQLYCWLHENWWGKGYLQHAFSLAVADYFKRTPYQTITAHVALANLQSYYALIKCGFNDQGLYHGPWGPQRRLVFTKLSGC